MEQQQAGKLYRRGRIYWARLADGKRVSLHTPDIAEARAKLKKLQPLHTPPAVPAVPGGTERPPLPDVAPVATDNGPPVATGTPDPMDVVGGGAAPAAAAAPTPSETAAAKVETALETGTLPDALTDEEVEAVAHETAEVCAALGCVLSAMLIRFAFNREPGTPSKQREERLVKVWKIKTRSWARSKQITPEYLLMLAHAHVGMEQYDAGIPLPSAPARK